MLMLAANCHQVSLGGLIHQLDLLFASKSKAQCCNNFLGCKQDIRMNVNRYAEKVAFCGKWKICLGKLAISLFCHGLLDSGMAEHVR